MSHFVATSAKISWGSQFGPLCRVVTLDVFRENRIQKTSVRTSARLDGHSTWRPALADGMPSAGRPQGASDGRKHDNPAFVHMGMLWLTCIAVTVQSRWTLVAARHTPSSTKYRATICRRWYTCSTYGAPVSMKLGNSLSHALT
jgi:hypothetical protein